jgi:alpha-N-acetylglucosamine transferase
MRFGRVFGLIEYEKVLLMDADLLVTGLQNDKIL